MDWFVVTVAAIGLAFVAWHFVSVVRREKRKDAGLPEEPLRKPWVSAEWLGGVGFGLGIATLAPMIARDGLRPEFLVTILIVALAAFFIFRRLRAVDRRHEENIGRETK